MTEAITKALEKRIAQLQQDNAELGESVTDLRRRNQKREGQLAHAQTQIANLAQEIRRIQGENEASSKHAGRLENTAADVPAIDKLSLL
jgi:septal ring factor EnvC (AmiA/AmiB activator)